MRQTFVNYDANHRHTTERDLSMINTHISAHVATQANRHSQDGTETRVPKTLAGQGQNMLAVPPLGPQIGGLRTDSFSVLPIKSTCYTSLALDYYTQIYAPIANQIGNINDLQSRTIMSHCLEDAMWCESLVSLMLTMRSLQTQVSKETSSIILHHSNNAVAELRRRLSIPEEMYSDLVIMTICALALIHRLQCEYAIYDAHVDGVRRIVAARGGLDKLGWHGMVKLAVVGMFESWEVRHLQTQQRFQNAKRGLVADATPSYPVHPLPSALGSKLMHFPPAFHRLALQQKLSLESIDYFELLFAWLDRLPRSPYSITELSHNVLSMPEFGLTERILVIGCQTYLNHLEGVERGWINANSERKVRRSVQQLDGDRCKVECNQDALVWSCLMVTATVEAASNTWFWADGILSDLKMTTERRLYLGQDFIPLPTRDTSAVPRVPATPSSRPIDR